MRKLYQLPLTQQTMYTIKDWHNSEKPFSEVATSGMEIDSDIYDYFLESTPPEYLGRASNAVARAAEKHGITGINQVLLAGEAISTVNGIPVYGAFIRSEDKYFFLGYMRHATVRPSLLESNEEEKKSWLEKAESGTPVSIFG